MQNILIILISALVLLSGVVHAEGRPWGVIAPFGNTTSPKGFQGRYNPWDNQIEGEDVAAEPSAPVQKRMRQDWQNIYRPRPTAGGDVWPDSQKSTSKGTQNSQRRMFGNESMVDEEEQWPERPEVRKPYRPMDSLQTPFGLFAPNMMPQTPGLPYGGFSPYRPGY